MDISFGNQKVRINIFNTPKIFCEEEHCSIINLIDEIVESESSSNLLKDNEPFNETQVQEIFDSPQPLHLQPWSIQIKPLPDLESEPLHPSIQAPPQLELKTLPESLTYAFLGPNKTLPVIIASDLTLEQEDQLMDVLKAHREAIGWTIADLKGISPSICMHHIYTEDSTKATREMQR